MRELAQRGHSRHEGLDHPGSFHEAGFVLIGGIDQWVVARGQDRKNPIILVLHGGPGAALSGVAFALFPGLERHFTVVHWDQRGAGRTYGRNGAKGSGDVTIERMTEDGIEVARHLCARFGMRQVTLCAVSWGSVLALGMLRRAPELFAAYIGTGQIVDMLGGEAFAYRTLLSRARKAGHRAALVALEFNGPPPFGNGKKRRPSQKWLLDFAPPSERRIMREMPLLLLSAPEMSLRDVWHTIAGVFFSYSRLFVSLMEFRADIYGHSFSMPMYFVQGADDLQTPTALVSEFCRRILAPRKAFMALDGGGHFIIRSMGGDFVREIISLLA